MFELSFRIDHLWMKNSVKVQTLCASKSLTNKRLTDGLYMSIPRRMSTILISRGVLPCPNEYLTLNSLRTTFL
jgi:hypothetical protein